MRMAQSEHHSKAEHQLKVEQQLFDVHTILDVKRAELELVVAQLVTAEQHASETGERVAQAETPLAARDYSAARHRLRQLQRRRDEALAEVENLVSTQDELLAKLVG